MSIGGWIMLIVSWVVILSLVIYCYKSIITARHPHLKAPLEIDTEED